MNLAAALKIHAPVTWVVTDEAMRVYDQVIQHSEVGVYRLGADGLILWDRDQTRWLRVLADGPEDTLIPIFSPGRAYEFVSENGGILVFNNAHMLVRDFFTHIASLSEDYRKTFVSDDLAHSKMRLVLVSCESKVPDEVARDVVTIHFGLPDTDEITSILTKVPEFFRLDKNDRTLLVRAAKGLAESELMRASADSLVRHKRLDIETINRFKIDTIKAGGVLEIRTPTMTLDDIGGMDRAKELIEAVAWTWHAQDEARSLGIEPLRRILMVGVPGSGKSAFCEANARTLGLELARTGVSQAMSKWVGESEANMRQVFKQIRALAPICMWIDEFGRDMSGSGSSSEVDGGTTDRVHGEFLTGLQELPDNVFLMCAANRIDSLPPEMLRADRFDKILFVGLPTEAERVDIFRIHLGERAVRYDLELLAAATATFTGAEIKALLREVNFRIGAAQHRAPTTDEIITAAPNLKGRVWLNHRSAIVEMYRRAVAEWEFASSAQEQDAELVLAAANGGTNKNAYAKMLDRV